MKGLWKESLGGWNNKDTRRKKQTRNNTLRDNGRAIYHIFNGYRIKRKTDTNVFRIENNIENVMTYGEAYPDRYKEIKSVDAFIIHWYGKTYEAYDFKGTWYNLETDKEIKPFNNNGLEDYMEEPNVSKYIGSYEFDDDIGREEANRKTNLPCGDSTRKEFIYGKYLPEWKWYTFYSDGSRRKYAQKIANRADRRNIKNWIKQKDISKPLKTHALSKSLAWEIN